jgi:hypothetical protein
MEMSKMKTLYDHYPELFDNFYHKFPNVVNVSKVVTTINDMDDAIGASRGCTLHWIKGNNIPGTASERRAGVYLRDKVQGPKSTEKDPNPEASMFLVSVPEGSKAKAAMLLSMMRNIDCEVVDF